MSKTKFSPALFEQLGGVNWQARLDGVGFVQPKESGSGPVEEESVKQVLQNEPSIADSVVLNDDHSSEVVEQVEQVELVESDEVASSKSKNRTELEKHIVVLGAGLDAVWQNDDNQAWLLWQNIMLAFNWDESNIVFFDTGHLVSDDMVFSTMEEIIELGVDWVLTMDDEHSISEQLQEGVHVVSVPDLELMLSDPYSKQVFYQSVVTITSGL